MKENNVLIQFNNVTFSYSDKSLLESISFTIRKGDFVGIVGPNGGGKTTMLKLLLGELKPKSGKIVIDGKNVLSARTEIGYLSQRLEADIDFPIKAFDVVLMGRLNSSFIHFYTQKDRQAVFEAMNQMSIIKLKDKLLSEMSGGERQRVLLARALVSLPKILVLDEPLVNVDHSTQVGFYEILTELNKKGLTVIIVDHNLNMLTDYVKTVICVNKCEKEHVRVHNVKSLGKECILKL